MKLTSTERAQIEKQRQARKDAALRVREARKVLLTVSDDFAVELARQITAHRKYATARDNCGCLKRTDELCGGCKKAFDSWFFGRIV